MNYENNPFFSKISRQFGYIKVFYPIGLLYTRLDYREFEPTGECNVSQIVKLLSDIGSANFVRGLVVNESVNLNPDILNNILKSAGPEGKKIPDRSFPLKSIVKSVLTQLPIKPVTERFPNSTDKSISLGKQSFSKWAIDFITSLVGPLDK